MEFIIVKTIKAVILIVAVAFAQAQEVTGNGIISQGFDQLFSIGLLLVILFMLYREYKAGLSYNQKRDERLETLLQNNTRVIQSITGSIEGNTKAIERNTQAVERLENKINDIKQSAA